MRTEHVARWATDVRHAPEDPAGPLHPLVAHHDEVGALTVGDADDGVGGVLGGGVELGGHPLRRWPGRPAGAAGRRRRSVEAIE